MKTPRDFDYDIWKNENGLYYVRVKRTGEITQVSEEIVRELWLELYRMTQYRMNTTIVNEDGSMCSRLISLDEGISSDVDDQDADIIGSENPYDTVETEMMESTFLKILTKKQRWMYHLRFKLGLTISECAKETGTALSSTEQLIRRIKEKAKRFF